MLKLNHRSRKLLKPVSQGYCETKPAKYSIRYPPSVRNDRFQTPGPLYEQRWLPIQRNNVPLLRCGSLFAPPLRPSRFQQYVRKSISLISARASVLEPQPLSLAPAARQSTVATAAAAAAAAASDRRIDELEAELAKLRAEWFDNEVKVRFSLHPKHFPED